MALAGLDLGAVRERYLRAALAGERREALRIIIDDAVALGAAVDEVRRVVVQQAQLEIGKLWETNAISVADEHMATAISQVALAHLYNHARPRATNGRSVLVACVPGELHDFPARLVADALDLEGFRVRFLGADVPAAPLVNAVLRDTPDLVALSVTMSFNVGGLYEAVGALVAAEARPPIVVGGRGCPKDLGRELAVAGRADDAETLVMLARQLTGLE